MDNSFKEAYTKYKKIILLTIICIFIASIGISYLICLQTKNPKSVSVSPIILGIDNAEFILGEHKKFNVSCTRLNDSTIDLVDMGISSISQKNKYTSIITSLKDLNNLSNITKTKENISSFTIPQNAYFVSSDNLGTFAWKETYQHYFSDNQYTTLNFGILSNKDIIHLSIITDESFIPTYSQIIYIYKISD